MFTSFPSHLWHWQKFYVLPLSPTSLPFEQSETCWCHEVLKAPAANITLTIAYCAHCSWETGETVQLVKKKKITVKYQLLISGIQFFFLLEQGFLNYLKNELHTDTSVKLNKNNQKNEKKNPWRHKKNITPKFYY